MATLQASSLLSSSYSSCSASWRDVKATHHASKLHTSRLSIPNLPNKDIVDEFNRRNLLQNLTSTQIEMKPKVSSSSSSTRNDEATSISMAVKELYAVMEVVADRSEMHKNIGTQRDNWNHLLLTSVNGITITAATMAGLAAVSAGGAPLLALKLSSSLLYMAATGILMVMNKIQPSQLAEEQRNAARLFKQLHAQIKNTIALKNPTSNDVNDAMEKVLALDKAYPLPLLGAMLDKFPGSVEPAVWWPKQLKSHHEKLGGKVERNGWSENLEEEMKEIVGVLKRKDTAEYLKLSKIVLRVNKILAFCGPLFSGVAAVGSAFLGYGSWAVVLGVAFGALATAVNTLEHGGQVGMVFEMYRSSAGFFKLMEEDIESTLKDKEADERENGELYEVKVALQLGRSLSELKNLASASSSSSSSSSSSPRSRDATEEFASKLF
ncbi:hypothetical protein L1049_000434 [Liquidambar formosana]|uniref:F-box protein n=1 Tax=Liquidambar formosana TaxID=63359 RepID=A0AAP0N8Z5_LIQFO